MLRVHFSHLLPDETCQYLEKMLDPNIVLTYGPQLSACVEYSILVNGRPSPEELTASPYLKTLIIPFAGIPEATRVMLLELPSLRVHNLHYNAPATAEMAMALLLAAAKCIVPIDRAFRKSDWSARYERNPSILLEGQSTLVLGHGAIGQRVGRSCLALGMRVLAIRQSIHEKEVVEGVEVFPPHELEALLPHANTLIICLPDTPETRGMINAKRLSLLPSNAILVNVARATIVDEEALFQALHDRKLFAAGLDVWYQYPRNELERGQKKPSRFPFHELDNVVMSPHRAADWDRSEHVRMEHLAQLLNCAARGEPMPNQVDPMRGY